MSKLSLQNVHKSFGDHHVLRGINIDVNESELVCLIGASGSGKSTALRTMNLLEPIDEGEIYLNGAEISYPGLDPLPIRRKIGIVFQSYNLFPHMTALENVLLAPKRVYGDGDELRQRAEALFSRVGLSARMHHYPDQLSGGQQQRVAIIRALAMQPEILLLDEITSALDPELVQEVLAVILQLKSEGMTMVMATHEMGFARKAADRVLFLNEGVVLEEGTPDAIFSDPQRERTKTFLSSVVAI